MEIYIWEWVFVGWRVSLHDRAGPRSSKGQLQCFIKAYKESFCPRVSLASHRRGIGNYSTKTDFQIWVNFSMLRCASSSAGSISSSSSNLLMFPRCWLHSSTMRVESGVLHMWRKGPERHPPGQASCDSEQTLSIWECQTLALGSRGLVSLHTHPFWETSGSGWKRRIKPSSIGVHHPCRLQMCWPRASELLV